MTILHKLDDIEKRVKKLGRSRDRWMYLVFWDSGAIMGMFVLNNSLRSAVISCIGGFIVLAILEYRDR